MLSVQLRGGFRPTSDLGVQCFSVERLQYLGFTHLWWIGAVALRKSTLTFQPQARNLHFCFALSPTNHVAGLGIGLSMDEDEKGNSIYEHKIIDYTSTGPYQSPIN